MPWFGAWRMNKAPPNTPARLRTHKHYPSVPEFEAISVSLNPISKVSEQQDNLLQ